MRKTRWLYTLGAALAVANGSAFAAWPWNSSSQCCPAPYSGSAAGPTTMPGATPPGTAAAPNAATPGDGSAFTPAGDTMTASAAESANPSMLGDFIGYQFFFESNFSGTGRMTSIPVVSRAAFKIAEGESPRPVDRVFAYYNYFNDVSGVVDPFAFRQPRVDVHQETFGFEKTYLDGDASIGMRFPVLQTRGLGDDSAEFGDISVVFKFAFFNDAPAGDVLSGGLVVTLPTGKEKSPDPNFHTEVTLLQPWLGFIYNFTPDLYMHGFSSVVFPMQSNDVTLFFNDVGFGYWLYRSANPRWDIIQGIVPTIEAHLTSPLNNNPNVGTFLPNDGFVTGITADDQLAITGGAHFLLPGRSVLTVGVATPVTGPRPYAVEGIVQFNVRF